MKEWNLIIDTGRETASLTLKGETRNVELHTSKSKHWCIEIRPWISIRAIFSLFSVKSFTKQEKKLAAKKIHRQFCHPPYEFLKNILSVFDPEDVDQEFLDILKSISGDNCDICKRFKPTAPRPCVGNLMSIDKMKFNEIVSIDLKFRKEDIIMYMIDIVTRFTRATFVPNKTKEVIIENIIKYIEYSFSSDSIIYR